MPRALVAASTLSVAADTRKQSAVVGDPRCWHWPPAYVSNPALCISHIRYGRVSELVAARTSEAAVGFVGIARQAASAVDMAAAVAVAAAARIAFAEAQLLACSRGERSVRRSRSP